MSQRQSHALFFLLTVATHVALSSSATDTFVYGGCSQLKFAPASTYESNVNSLLTSLVNSAGFNIYGNVTIQGSTKQDTVYGLFQCQGNLAPADCGSCVARAVSQVGMLCLDACGGALQLDSCFIRYDNVSFLGVEDKTLVVKKCGPSIGFDDQDALTGLDGAVSSLGSNGGSYRVSGSGAFQGVAQCTGDLSPSECQDCLSVAIGRMRTDCGVAKSADVYLAKCYARYWQGGSQTRAPRNDDNNKNNDDEVQKTLAIIIGLIAGVTLLVVFASFLGKQCRKLQDGK